MNRLMFLGLFFALIGLQGVHAASFDCATANRFVEKTVCSNQELLRLDEEVSKNLAAAIKDNPQLKDQQLKWLSDLKQCGSQAVPADCLKNAYRFRAKFLEISGRPNRGQVGISLQAPVKLPNGVGFHIGAVAPNSPAAMAGVVAGDVLTAINGVGVTDLISVLDKIAVPAGTVLNVKLLKADRSEAVARITVAERSVGSPGQQPTPAAPQANAGSRRSDTSVDAPVIGDFCKRFVGSKTIQQLAQAMKRNEHEVFSRDFDQFTYLDNKNRDLEKWVVAKLQSANLDRRSIQQTVSDCLVKNANQAVAILGTYSTYVDYYNTTLAGRASFYVPTNELVKQGVLSSGNPPPRSAANIATVLAFMFPGAEAMIEQVAKDPLESLNASLKRVNASQAQAAQAEDSKKYDSMRAIYRFRTNAVLAAPYKKCIDQEKVYQKKQVDSLETEVKKVATVAEQKQLQDVIKMRRELFPAIVEGMCLYRLSVGIKLVDSAGIDPVEAGVMYVDAKGDLNAQFTQAGLEKIASVLSISADSFHKNNVGAPSNKAQMIYGMVYETFVQAMAAGKLQ